MTFFYLPSAKEEKVIVVYKATNLVNGKMYWGKSCYGARHRARSHKFQAIRKGINTPFYAALRKYGEELFSVSVVATCETNAEAYKIEQRMIGLTDKLLRYNLSDGGIGPTGKRTPEQRARMSVAQRRSGHHKNLKGVKRSPEAIANMKAVQSRIVHPHPSPQSLLALKNNRGNRSKPVWCLETGEFYLSSRDADRAAGAFVGSVNHILDVPNRRLFGKHYVSHVG